MMDIVWFRTDLRLAHNKVLDTAYEYGKRVLPLFVIDPRLIKRDEVSPLRLSFMAESLIDLDRNLRKAGSRLLVVKAIPEELFDLLSGSIDSIFMSKDYSRFSLKRDESVRKSIESHGGTFEAIINSVVFDHEDSLLTTKNEPIKMFTHFKTQWLKRLYDEPQRLLTAQPPLSALFQSKTEVGKFSKRLSELGYEVLGYEQLLSYKQASLFRGGERVASKKWKDFKSSKLYLYHTARNSLATSGTSMLSPHFKWGTISVFEVVRDCVSLLGPSFYKYKQFADGELAGIESYLSEIIWREFYKYILAMFPHVENGSFVEKYNSIKWENNDQYFEAWTQGKTGVPIVDACMRQMNQTGWMHNRGRMIVASFLCKDLHIDWRKGERYFRLKLVDFDKAANNGGWQWTAGTGTDASPYFRIFNPYTQGKKFDPNGDYIKKYVPELRDVPVKYIHEPSLMQIDDQEKAHVIIGHDYPFPIVDHDAARKKTLKLYKRE